LRLADHKGQHLDDPTVLSNGETSFEMKAAGRSQGDEPHNRTSYNTVKGYLKRLVDTEYSMMGIEFEQQR